VFNTNRQPESSLMIKLVRDVIFGVRTLTPARVVSVDRDGENKPIFATVQPLLQETRNIDDATPDNLPEIDRVPVWMPRTRKCVLNLPLEKDDIVALIIPDRSLDNWLQSNEGEPIDYQDTRDHALTDAICFPGFYPYTFDDPTKANQSDFGAVRQIGSSPTDIVNMVIEEGGNVKISTGHTVNISGGVVNVGAGQVNIGSGENEFGIGGDINEVAEGDFTQAAEGDMDISAEGDTSVTSEGDMLVDADGTVNMGGLVGEPAIKGDTACAFFDAHLHVCPILGASGVPTLLTATSVPSMKSAKVKVDG